MVESESNLKSESYPTTQQPVIMGDTGPLCLHAVCGKWKAITRHGGSNAGVIVDLLSVTNPCLLICTEKNTSSKTAGKKALSRMRSASRGISASLTDGYLVTYQDNAHSYEMHITMHTHMFNLLPFISLQFFHLCTFKGRDPAEAPKGGPSNSYPLSVINVFLMALLLTFPSFHYGSTSTIFIASATLCSAFSPSQMGSVEGQELETQLYMRQRLLHTVNKLTLLKGRVSHGVSLKWKLFWKAERWGNEEKINVILQVARALVVCALCGFDVISLSVWFLCELPL